jgi:hypothetical protein
MLRTTPSETIINYFKLPLSLSIDKTKNKMLNRLQEQPSKSLKYYMDNLECGFDYLNYVSGCEGMVQVEEFADCFVYECSFKNELISKIDKLKQDKMDDFLYTEYL